MSEYDRYINLPGFDNVNRALTLFNVPVDLYRQGDASVDALANPDNLPTRDRVERGIESLVGTAAYGLGPLFARLGGQKATQAISEMLMGFSGPQAAEEVVKDVVQDPSRRKFIGGVAATVPVAALAPDVITDVVTKAAKTGSRAPINPINMAMANIRALKGQIDEKYEILDEIQGAPDASNLNAKVADDAQSFIIRSQYEIQDEALDVMEQMSPADVRGASDDAIEEIVSIQYDPMNAEFFGGDAMQVGKITPLNSKYKLMAEEIKRRGLDKAKDRNGILKYPNARTFIEDVEMFNEKFPISLPNPSMQMVRKADFADDYLKENVQKINDENIQNIIEDGRIEKKSTEEINKNIVRYAEQNNIPAPRRAFDNPKVEYISTKEIADNIAQFNYPRYDVGKFGGDLPSGNLNENPQFLEQFEKSGQETLKENIFNEGIKEPIEIELVLSNGEISIGQGHHRLQAAIELNLPEVPVIVKTKENPRPVSAAVMRPGRVNTSGLENYTDYSYSELNLTDRFIAPKETPDEIQQRGGSGFLDPETGEFTDRKSPRFYTPMRQGFFRNIEKKAFGGAVESMQPSDLHRQIQQADRLMRADGKTTKEIDIFKQQKRREIFEGPTNNRVTAGVGSLNQTARDMFRGPRGIESLSRFSDGGEATARDKVEIESLRNAVMMTESNGDPNAVSPKGAIGLMQIMPKTARNPGFGVENAFEIADKFGYVYNDMSDATLKRLLMVPEINVELGNQYLDAMLNQYTEVDDALRAYNAGKTNVDRFIASGRNLEVLTDEAVQYPIKVTAALQGYSPKDMNEMAMFEQSPETASALMSDYPAPPEENRMFTAPPIRPQLPPSFATEVRPPQREFLPVIPGQQTNLFEQYGGIANLATSVRPRPRPSQLN